MHGECGTYIFINYVAFFLLRKNGHHCYGKIAISLKVKTTVIYKQRKMKMLDGDK